MRYRLQRHDGTDCSATMVPITVLRMVPIQRYRHLEGKPNFHLHYADLGDSMSILQVVSKVRPTEIYNLAAQSHVQVSFDSPEFTADVDATGVLRVLEAVRLCGLKDTCRIYQAST